ncbi:hypothetical protein Tco_0945452 [Tanacetum coccineum]
MNLNTSYSRDTQYAVIEDIIVNILEDIKRGSPTQRTPIRRANPADCLSLVTEYLEKEEAEAMAETMEQYMSKTRRDYRSGVSRPKIEEKDSFELKGQFLMEL